MSTKLSTGRVRSTYAFIKAHRKQYSVQALCRILGVAPSGYYEWILQPLSARAQEDARLVHSGIVHGEPRCLRRTAGASSTCGKRRDL